MKIRVAKLNDLKAIKELLIRNGLKTSNLEKVFLESDLEVDKKAPLGWVIEENQSLKGVLLNFIINYHHKGSVYKAAVASTWLVEKKFRSLSIPIFLEYLKQKDVDIFIDSTATRKVGRILKSLKFNQVPEKEYASMFWITNYQGLIKSLIRKYLINSRLLSKILAAPLAIFDYLILRKSFLEKDVLVEKSLNQEKFDTFWSSIQKGNEFLANRDSNSLNWRFIKGLEEKSMHLFCQYKDELLVGYIFTRKTVNKKNGSRRLQICDYQVLPEFKHLSDLLLSQVLLLAKEKKYDLVEYLGDLDLKKKKGVDRKPLIRKLGHCPFYYKINNNELKKLINKEEVWSKSLFDGDGCLR